RRGLIIERSRRYEVFSRAFARWIQDQPDPVPHANPHHAARQSRSSCAAAQVNDDEAKETPESFVFISYTRHDGEFALELAEYLKQNQIRVWIDQIDIPSGVPWDLYIEDAIRDATVLLPILTTESIGSINVRNEIHYAIKAGKLVLPLVYRPCPIPLMLQAIHYLDYHQDAEKALSELLERLQAYPKLRPGGE
ncbi:MAG: toll/interleukin-1 receptor domain-containing protein, partial [Anaerolineae bacterium]|nr:toll/interleukin-1 receptor domain-containing protein [Anaerolineae bacterium]